ncbi:MAG: hypothetical protein ACR2J8_14845, partial [Thermomicrobiales bacterium]
MTTRSTGKKAVKADESSVEGDQMSVPEAVYHAATMAETEKPKTTRRPRTSSRTKKPAPLLLPVLVVEETLLLPHMSIPFPIEDEESAMVLERATRMEPRQVLVLTERPVFVEGDRPDIEDGLR